VSSAWVLLSVAEEAVVQLRYGMNPHQAVRVTEVSGRVPVRIVSGEPSYLNLLDVLNASQLVREAAAATGSPVATSFKHVLPAGVATAGAVDDTARETWGLTAQVGSLTSAYVRARDSDPKSSFGDVIAVSEPVDAELAELLSRVVADGIVAPGYELGTVEVLSRKKRGTFLVAEADPGYRAPVWERHDVHGLVLEQERDQAPITADLLRASESGELVAAGTVGDALGRETTEKDEPDTAGIAAFRIVGERACLDFAARGVRASVVRLAPTVHGPGDYGFIGMLIATARKTGVSAYVGDGGNRWPAVHRLDARSCSAWPWRRPLQAACSTEWPKAASP
jgi:hypothetical protein